MRSESSLATSAREYAERGWPVHPLATRAKNPLLPNGVLQASTDIAEVTEWWQRWPNANIGLRTGVTFDVLDIDGEVGWTSMSAKAGSGTAHPGPVSRTGRGIHWLYRPTGTTNRAGMLEKLDWRGIGGYIAAPPSIHPDGATYEWDSDHGPDTELTEPPEWLVPLLVKWKPPTIVEPIIVIQTNPFDKRHLSKEIASNPLRLAALKDDIVATARELGYNPVPRGPRFIMQCIFHTGDNEASLTLYPSDNSFFCYGCGAWGDVLNLREKRAGGTRG